MILLERLLLEIFGKKYIVTAYDPAGKEVKRMPALASKNTKVSEKPFRFTWFNDQLMPYKHYDMDDAELKQLFDHNTLPSRIEDKILNYMKAQEGGDLQLLKVEPDPVPF